MRVVAGSRRSLPLKSLEGDRTRPTLDRYKETLFNVLQTYVPYSRFLDLFAGSGSIGIEALSRGADRAVFVENNKDAISVISENVRFTKFTDTADILKKDALTYLRNLRNVDFNIIYIDPPYGQGLEKDALLILDGKTFTDEGAIIVIEALLDEDMSYIEDTRFEIFKVKEYKTNKHVFLRLKEK